MEIQNFIKFKRKILRLMSRKKEGHKKIIQALLYCLLLFSNTHINLGFINNDDNLKNSGGYEYNLKFELG